MASGDRLTLEDVLAGFDVHLRRTRGVCPGTRRNYARFARAFLQSRFADGPLDVAEVRARDVVEFVVVLSRRYRLWVPETRRTGVDLPLRRRPEFGMIRRWRCG